MAKSSVEHKDASLQAGSEGATVQEVGLDCSRKNTSVYAPEKNAYSFFSKDKQGMRKEALARRAAILGSDCLAYASEPSLLPAQIADFLNEKNPAVLALYLPFRGELDVVESLKLWIATQPESLPRFCIPRVSGDDLIFHEIDVRYFTEPECRGDYCESGYAGLTEPRAELAEIAVSEIDCFLIPGVAFDTAGYRMGYGKGFYDRALEHAKPDVLKVGISYEELLVEKLPTEAHDVPMNFILTPRRRLDFK